MRSVENHHFELRLTEHFSLCGTNRRFRRRRSRLERLGCRAAVSDPVKAKDLLLGSRDF